MEPNSGSQIRWGIGACLAALALVLILALVPDPFFRNRAYVTQLDDVAGIQPGTELDFRGASVGDVTDVALDPKTRRYTVKLSISKDFQPSACSHVAISAANPLTAPRMSLVVLEGAPERSAPACRLARAAEQCEPIPVRAAQGGSTIVGCKRQPDLIQTAALAVGEAANAAKTAGALAQRLQGMLPTPGAAGGAGGPDLGAAAGDVTATLAALNDISTKLNHSFTPGRGDIAMTLSNVRSLTGRAAQLDVASANGILLETRSMLAQNQVAIAELLKQGVGSATEARATLEGASSSMVQASANLERITQSLGALSERVAADPTFTIRGQKYADPPSPGAPQ